MPMMGRDAHPGEGSRDPVLPGAKLSPGVPGSWTERDVKSNSSRPSWVPEGYAYPQERFSYFPLL